MPTLPTILVNNDATAFAREWASQSYLDIDEGITGADGNTIQAANTTENRNVSLATSFELGPMPADFASMTSLNFNIRYRANSNSGDDTLALLLLVSNAGTLAGQSVGVHQVVKTGLNTTWHITLQNSGVTAFNYVNTSADKATWDGAVLTIRSTHTANMGPDDNFVIVDTIEFTGVYVASAAASLVVPARKRAHRHIVTR